MTPEELAAIEARHDALFVEQCRQDLIAADEKVRTLTAEVKRLRGALESIAEERKQYRGLYVEHVPVLSPEDVLSIARAALTQEPSND